MIAPVDFSRIQQALATAPGWIDLGVTAACLGLAWLLDVRIQRARNLAPKNRFSRFAGLLYPLTALAFTLIATAAYRHFAGPPFFLAIAVPLLIALVVIRMLVYALRSLFGEQLWLRTSETAISFTIWGLAALYFLGVLPEIWDALGDIAIPMGKTRVPLAEMLKGAAAVVATLVITLWISGALEQRLTLATQLDSNLRVVFGKFIRALLLIVGVLIALQQVGFDLTLLSVFGGALGVGIGLGLQKLASNYIAGFTILLDRSIRLGDMITVDGRSGFVSKVTSRYVVVRSLDGVEAIVPNETLVTTTVLNHSYTSHDIRVAVQVQISYDSDVELALKILCDIANRHERILKGANAPSAVVVGLADSGINLELGVWINDPHLGQAGLRSDISRALLKEFAANGIAIPFPQREVRILNGGGSKASGDRSDASSTEASRDSSGASATTADNAKPDGNARARA